MQKMLGKDSCTPAPKVHTKGAQKHGCDGVPVESDHQVHQSLLLWKGTSSTCSDHTAFPDCECAIATLCLHGSDASASEAGNLYKECMRSLTSSMGTLSQPSIEEQSLPTGPGNSPRIGHTQSYSAEWVCYRNLISRRIVQVKIQRPCHY